MKTCLYSLLKGVKQPANKMGKTAEQVLCQMCLAQSAKHHREVQEGNGLYNKVTRNIHQKKKTEIILVVVASELSFQNSFKVFADFNNN